MHTHGDKAAVASAATGEFETLVEVGLTALLQLPYVEMAAIGLSEEGTCATYWRGRTSEAWGKLVAEPGAGLYGWAVRTGSPVVLESTVGDPRAAASLIELPDGPCIIHPFSGGTAAVKGFAAVHRQDGPGFTLEEKEHVRAIGSMIQSSRTVRQKAYAYEQQAKYFRAVTEIARVLAAAVDTRAVLALVVDMAMTLSPAVACWLFLNDAAENQARLAVARAVPREALASLRPGVSYGPGLLHRIPIARDGEEAGSLEMMAPRDLHPWEQEALQALGNMVGVALRHLQLQHERERLSEEAILALVAALEARDPYTQGHSVRVGEYAAWLGDALGLDSQEIRKLRVGGYLHDVGKIGVPEAVLLKPGRYTPEEFELMKRHPVIGYQIVSHLGSLTELLPLVRSHHERLDGSGYPDGLTAGQIPHTVRIMAVADVFEALVSDRPYRQGMRPEEAFAILEEGAGRLFDRDLVNLFIQAVRSHIALGLFPPRLDALLQRERRPQSTMGPTGGGGATTPSPPPDSALVTGPNLAVSHALRTGYAPLTEREREILDLVAHGLTNSEIATRLHLTLGTVKTHVSRILTKLGLRDRTKAAVYALRSYRTSTQ